MYLELIVMLTCCSGASWDIFLTIEKSDFFNYFLKKKNAHQVFYSIEKKDVIDFIDFYSENQDSLILEQH